MADRKQPSLPQTVIDEAWTEYLYPRSAVGDLADADPQSGFTRAMRVMQQWATEHDKWWAAVRDITERQAREGERRALRAQLAEVFDQIRLLDECTGCHDVTDVATHAAQHVSDLRSRLADPS